MLNNPNYRKPVGSGTPPPLSRMQESRVGSTYGERSKLRSVQIEPETQQVQKSQYSFGARQEAAKFEPNTQFMHGRPRNPIKAVEAGVVHRKNVITDQARLKFLELVADFGENVKPPINLQTKQGVKPR